MHPQAEDGPLAGGTANRGRVIKVGDTVRRPRGAYSPAVHALLRHLRAAGFDGAPQVIGVDGATEILGYIAGTAATIPLADWARTDEVLESVGGLLRTYHQHARGFDGGSRRWQRPLPERWQGTLITHNDVNPANVIFRGGRAVALIDFDLAGPGTPAFDLAVTACFWVPLYDPADIPDDRRDRVPARYRLLLDAYGADGPMRADVADALPAAYEWITDVIEDSARNGHPAFISLWERDQAVHTRAAAWLAAHVDELRKAGSS